MVRRTRAVAVCLVLAAAVAGHAPAEAGDRQQGGIAGTVSGPDGPLPDVCVYADGGYSGAAGEATTDAAGRYQMDVDPQAYELSFRPCRVDSVFMQEYYDDAFDARDATMVDVTAGEVTTGIDAELEVGGTITGVVTDEAGRPAAGVCIYADHYRYTVRDHVTDERGRYRVVALKPGRWTLRFYPCSRAHRDNNRRLRPEFWDDEQHRKASDKIQVRPGSSAVGLDAALHQLKNYCHYTAGQVRLRRAWLDIRRAEVQAARDAVRDAETSDEQQAADVRLRRAVAARGRTRALLGLSWWRIRTYC